MNRIIAVTLLAAASFLSPAIQAAPVTIDFEEFNVGDAGGLFLPPLQSQGYDISGSVVTVPAEILIGTNTGTKSFGGTVSGATGGPGLGFTIAALFERTDGGAFAIHSLDLLLETDPLGFTSITGSLSGGGAANLGVPVGSGDWLNLESLSFFAESNPNGFGGATIEIDNVVVSAVPIPAAVWLFGSGLGLLGWFRRRQTA
jgi:hypothetical protein